MTDSDTDNGDVPRTRQLRRGIYLLPNIFTTGTLFGGFYAIIAATQGRFSIAAVAIFVAMLMDMLDGRVARLTHTQSEFGIQYDSLADLVAFGLASSLVAYLYSLQSLAAYGQTIGKIGWLAAFFYAAAAALRLARFNITRVGPTEKKVFFGLPSPAAAGLLVGFVWVGNDWGLSGASLVIPVFILTVVAGALMVSNVRFQSFKSLKFGERVPFMYILIMVAGLVLVMVDPPRVLFIAFLLYAASGPVQLYRAWRRRGHAD